MKSIPTTFILLLCLSLSCALTNLTKKGSTVLDYLKDGFDTVYKYEEQSTFSHQKLKEFEGKTFDVLLRKSSQDDSKKFVMHVENVQLRGTHEEPPTEAVLALPIIVAVQNEDLDMEHVYATEADTKKSLQWKHDALTLLLHNMTENVKDFSDIGLVNSVTIQMEMDDMPFGSCKMEFSVKKEKGKMLMEMSTRRDQCIGPLDKDLLEAFKKYDAIDVHGRSELKFAFIYDKTTGQFLKSYLKMKGRLVSEVESTFSLLMKLNFDSFKEIQDNFDETLNSKMYKESDIE